MPTPKILLVNPDGSSLQLTGFKVAEDQISAKELPWPLSLESSKPVKPGVSLGKADGKTHVLVMNKDQVVSELPLPKRLREIPVTTIHTPLTPLQRNTLRLFGLELDSTQKVFVSLGPIVGAKTGIEGDIDINVSTVQRQITDARKLADSPNMAAVMQYFDGPCIGCLMALSASQSLWSQHREGQLGASDVDLRFLNFLITKARKASDRMRKK